MAKQLQLRGGTTAEHSTFTGAAREITVDTDKDVVVVHDGLTAGGVPLAKEDHTHTGYQPAGTYNTIIGTDDDITASGSTVVSSVVMTDGVITSHATRTLTLGDLGYTGETNATADMTAAEILTAIKTVDGAGSGLDADLLDGQSSAYYATASHTHTGVYEPADATILKDADIGVTIPTLKGTSTAYGGAKFSLSGTTLTITTT